jgi:hypothetical protein
LNALIAVSPEAHSCVRLASECHSDSEAPVSGADAGQCLQRTRAAEVVLAHKLNVVAQAQVAPQQTERVSAPLRLAPFPLRAAEAPRSAPSSAHRQGLARIPPLSHPHDSQLAESSPEVVVDRQVRLDLDREGGVG